MARTVIGTVVSDKMDKTVNVAIDKLRSHPLYRKQYKVTKKFLAHDENNDCKVGDKVELRETRPTSKGKRWEVVSVIEKGSKV